MLVDEELTLLIKSNYSVIFFETVDEAQAIARLNVMASKLGLDYFQWSLTEGLRRGSAAGSYYQTSTPAAVLRMVAQLSGPGNPLDKAGLFVFKDFEKYLDDQVVVRLFKDIVHSFKGTKNTFVIVSANYKLPKEIEVLAAHLTGGMPSDDEIREVIRNTIEECMKQMAVRIDLTQEQGGIIVSALRGLTVQQIRNVINQCALNDNAINAADIPVIEAYKKKIFDQDGLLEFCLTEQRSSLAGFDNLKRWLTERKGVFHQSDRQLPLPKGVLLMGVQGCGKSMAVKIIAREFELPLYRLDLGRLYSKYIGETEENLRKAFGVIEKLGSVCLWIDEIEKGFAVSSGDVDGGVSQRLLGSFLTWMQERKTNCFIAATANDVFRLPPELLRKGRFDEIFFVDLPDAPARQNILKLLLKNRKLEPDGFDLEGLARMTDGFSGAEIEQVIISALYRASSNGAGVTTASIAEQVVQTRPLSVVKKEEIDRLRAWASERTIPA